MSIVASSLSKAYGAVQAVDSVSLDVGRGELFGLIGPDGAGKSTLIRMLVSLIVPDGGEGSIDGFDIVSDYREVRQRVGYMPGRFSLYQDLTVEENLAFFASVFGTTVDANFEMIEDIYGQLLPFKTRKAGALSGGMKQKLALSCALVHRPSVLLLDEPTTGVDAVSRIEFWDMLDEVVATGIPVLVSTPYMDEAERCHRVALMQGGRIMDVDTPAGLIEKFEAPLFGVRGEPRLKLIETLRAYPHAVSVHPFGDSLHYVDDRSSAAASTIAEDLRKSGFEDVDVRPIRPTVEDCFMGLMQ